MSDISQVCRSCKYWVGTGKQRQCYRYPKQAGGVIMAQHATVMNPTAQPQPAIVWGYPGMNEDDWCGEWTPILGQAH